MPLADAVIAAGRYPRLKATQARKKRYSEVLSRHLSIEVADGLRKVGLPHVRPLRNGPGERAFQGGLGPKKVDVTYSDERHGLLLAVSIKSITSPPYGKNLKNRFADLCTEAITLHMRFPYSVICGLFAFPVMADQDVTPGRRMSTFRRATKLLATISGRENYTDPGEKFERIATLLFQPLLDDSTEPQIQLFDALTETELSEDEYFRGMKDLFNRRNPHVAIEEEIDPLDED
jgi:hypothetical protein